MPYLEISSPSRKLHNDAKPAVESSNGPIP
jgi:hypothetical protein